MWQKLKDFQLQNWLIIDLYYIIGPESTLDIYKRWKIVYFKNYNIYLHIIIINWNIYKASSYSLVFQ